MGRYETCERERERERGVWEEKRKRKNRNMTTILNKNIDVLDQLLYP